MCVQFSIVVAVLVTFVSILLPPKYGPLFVEAQVGTECHFDRMTPRHSLSLRKLMGPWYLHEFASSDRNYDGVTPGFKCSSILYEGSPAELQKGKFLATETYTNSSDGRTHSFKMPIKIPDNRNVVNAIWSAETANGATQMMVLGSDMKHVSWHLVYSCNIVKPNSTRPYRWETVAIWGRDRSIAQELRDTLKALIIGLGLPLESHKLHSQTDCK